VIRAGAMTFLEKHRSVEGNLHTVNVISERAKARMGDPHIDAVFFEEAYKTQIEIVTIGAVIMPELFDGISACVGHNKFVLADHKKKHPLRLLPNTPPGKSLRDFREIKIIFRFIIFRNYA